MTTPNPAPYPELIVAQLSDAEWDALLLEHSGIAALPNAPGNAAADHPLDRLANAHFFGHPGCSNPYAVWQAHKALMASDLDAYLEPAIPSLSRRSQLVAGAWLMPCDTSARSSPPKVACVKCWSPTKPDGFFRMVTLFYSGAANPQTAVLRAQADVADVDTNLTTFSAVKDAILAQPTGHRVLCWTTPGYKAQTVQSEWVLATLDGTATGDFPGIGLENYASGVSGTLGAYLDGLVSAGLTVLNYFVTDIEFKYNVDDLAATVPKHGSQVGSVWFNLSGERWYEALDTWLDANPSVVSTYNFPSVTGIQSASLTSDQVQRFHQAACLYQRDKLRALRAIVSARFPGLYRFMDYDDFSKAGAVVCSTSQLKRFASRFGGGGRCSDVNQRNLYLSTSHSSSTQRAYFPQSGGDRSTPATNWTYLLYDYLTIASNANGSRLPQVPWQTTYTNYSNPPQPQGVRPDNSATHYAAYVHHVMCRFASSDSLTPAWIQSKAASTTYAQNLMRDAYVEADAACLGIVGTLLPPADRADWNINDPIVLSRDLGSQIVTLTIEYGGNGEPGAYSFSYRDNTINQPPYLEAPIVGQSATEGSAYSLQIVAEDPEGEDISFALVSGPPGMTCSPTGLVGWTPGEQEGGTIVGVIVRATDESGASADFTWQITVAEGNTAPTLEPIGNQTATENQTSEYPIVASDPDNPAQVLTFSLVGLVPTGMELIPGALPASIEASMPWTATLRYTPPEGSAASSPVSVTVKVQDSWGTPASDQETIQITIAEGNLAPYFAPIDNAQATEGVLLVHPIPATDPDIPSTFLSYSLVSGPAGSIAAGGFFIWTPPSGTGGTTVSVTVRATDSGSPALSGTATFSVTISDSNTPPTIDPIADQQATEGELFTLQIEASDADTPAQELTYSLISGPTGVEVDPGSGVLTWTPNTTHVGMTFTITVSVTDSGDPPYQVQTSFDIEVLEADTPFAVVLPFASATVKEGGRLSFITGIDPAGTAVEWGLDAVAPFGAAIHETTGRFSWRVRYGQAGTHTIYIRATDPASPIVTDAEPITVTVLRGPNQPWLSFDLDGPSEVTLDGTYSDQAMALAASPEIELRPFGGNEMHTWRGTVGATLIPLAARLLDANKQPEDLTLSSLSFELYRVPDGTADADVDTVELTQIVTAGVTEIVDAEQGRVAYNWASADVSEAGLYIGWFVRTQGGKPAYYPVDGRKLRIELVDAG